MTENSENSSSQQRLGNLPKWTETTVFLALGYLGFLAAFSLGFYESIGSVYQLVGHSILVSELGRVSLLLFGLLAIARAISGLILAFNWMPDRVWFPASTIRMLLFPIIAALVTLFVLFREFDLTVLHHYITDSFYYGVAVTVSVFYLLAALKARSFRVDFLKAALILGVSATLWSAFLLGDGRATKRSKDRDTIICLRSGHEVETTILHQTDAFIVAFASGNWVAIPWDDVRYVTERFTRHLCNQEPYIRFFPN